MPRTYPSPPRRRQQCRPAALGAVTAVLAGGLVASAAGPALAYSYTSKDGPRVCQLVPGRQIAAVIKKKVINTRDAPQHGANWYANLCTYTSPRGPGLLGGVTMLLVATGGSNYYSTVQSEPFKWQKVAGIGDKAIFYQGSLFVQSGHYAFNVEQVPSSFGVSLSEEVTIGKALLAALKA